MTDLRFLEVDTLDFAYRPRNWPWAEREAERLDRHWAEVIARNPALFDGPVLVLHEGALEGRTFRGAYLPTRFSRFLGWRDFGFPDAAMRNCFGMAALRAGDGAYLLGVMGGHTANAGKVYFPAGTPDPDDIVGDRVDIAGSVLRELEEETGLPASRVRVGEGWTLIEAGPRIACMREVVVEDGAEAVRDGILRSLAGETEPELADMLIVRTLGDLAGRDVPPFVRAYVEAKLA